jgi:PTH1 family peptidyl-tRNA hydrolase
LRIVAWLGNPGAGYERTRHNAGFRALDLLAARAGARGSFEEDAWVAEATGLGSDPVLLVKPLRFMNLSGAPLARLLAGGGGSPGDLLVIVDDVALELGTVRVRERGGHGGHNGLRSICEELGSEDFARIRIGVRRGELPSELADYVLSEPPAEELEVFGRGVTLAADAACWVLREGAPSAMNEFNGRRA